MLGATLFGVSTGKVWRAVMTQMGETLDHLEASSLTGLSLGLAEIVD